MKFSIIICFVLFIWLVDGGKLNNKQNFCQTDRCLTCIGRYCTTTCRGTSCKDCPIGDCCNGTNCNICRGNTCCQDLQCNNCIQDCLETCTNKTICHYECFQRCVPEEEVTKSQLVANHITNYLPVNVTTVINITNTITNENTIHNPVIMNSTNIFNHTVNDVTIKNDTNTDNTNIDNSEGDEEFINENDGIDVITPKIDNNCCIVVHPRICQRYHTQKYCFIGKHRECSNLCSSKFVHIVEKMNDNNTNYSNNCIFIGVRPYFFCGNYQIENCDACYECPDIGDNCQETTRCNENCRDSIIRDNLYNTLFLDNRSILNYSYQ